jgi:galactokinase
MTQSQLSLADKVLHTFRDLYKEEPIITRSPGRVNIIGEHLDYNDGYVLPAAIDKAIYVGISKRNDNKIHLHSVDYNEDYTVTLEDIKPTKDWATYILGVTDQLIKRGHRLSGFNVVLDGDVPVGAGLSSSAAVECAAVFALNELFSLGIDKMEMVKIAQKAEQTFAGVMVGIMDMFASMFGKKDHVIKLDCRSLEYEYKPLKLQGYKLVLFNTNVKHSLSSSEYNTRRKQCEQGVAWVKEHYPQVTALRDVDMNMLNKYVLPKDEIIYKRCKYVVEEIDRLLTGCDDLERGDIKGLGEKMFRTHEGLSKEYEVSCKELDFLVDAVKGNEAVIGARMMGGGFGGCTINIIKEEAINDLQETLSKEYTKAMGLELTTYIAQIENGTERVT